MDSGGTPQLGACQLVSIPRALASRRAFAQNWTLDRCLARQQTIRLRPGTRVDLHAVIDQVAPAPTLRIAGPADGPRMLHIITESFRARPALNPPADALGDTLADVEHYLSDQIGIIASDDTGDIGCLFLALNAHASPPTGMLLRVSVLPGQRQHGIATQMVRAAAGLAQQAGMRRLQLVARRELPSVIRWWQGHGFEIVEELDATRVLIDIDLPASLRVPTAAAMRAFGARLAELLRPGDLIVASGELGSGKTTLAQGMGAGLRVAGPITSPTFVLSRIHPGVDGGVQLVHVDAYRLGSAAELDDLDLDATLADSVTLVEWGTGLADQLAGDRLEIHIDRSGDPDDETRTVRLTGIGPRWAEVDLWKFVDQFTDWQAEQ